VQTFNSLFISYLQSSVSQSGRNRPLGGDFEGQGGEKIKGGDRAAKKHQGDENVQPLIER